MTREPDDHAPAGGAPGDAPPAGGASPDERATLGRVADLAALDAGTGPRGAMTLTLPDAWLDEGGPISFVAPKRLACARCGGGGCDACARTGVVRAPEADHARLVSLSLPRGARGTLRIPAPFGDGSIELLLLSLERGEASHRALREALVTPSRGAPDERRIVPVAIALVVALAVALALATSGR